MAIKCEEEISAPAYKTYNFHRGSGGSNHQLESNPNAAFLHRLLTLVRLTSPSILRRKKLYKWESGLIGKVGKCISIRRLVKALKIRL